MDLAVFAYLTWVSFDLTRNNYTTMSNLELQVNDN